jgi:hypothetical protein
MNEFHEEISCKHPLQGSAQGLGKLKQSALLDDCQFLLLHGQAHT